MIEIGNTVKFKEGIEDFDEYNVEDIQIGLDGKRCAVLRNLRTKEECPKLIDCDLLIDSSCDLTNFIETYDV